MKTLLILSMDVLDGGTSVPPTNVHQPMSMRPQPRPEFGAGNGAIFQNSFARPLFEDRRARNLGDTITITITENTSASKKSNNKLDRSATNEASVSAMNGMPGKRL